MDQSRRFLPQITFLTLAFAACSLSAWAQPSPAKPDSSPTSVKAAPAGGPTVPTTGPVAFGPPVPMLSPALNGIITPEEGAKLQAFQQQLSQDPAVKEMNARIGAQIKELQHLQAEANALREKLIAANPEIKAIQDKIIAAGRAHARPMPFMMPGNTPAPGPGPVPAKTN